MGVVYWKCLTRPLKIYWLWHVFAIVSFTLVSIYDYRHYTRISIERALMDVGMGMVTGWFCIELFQKRSEKIVIGICYAALFSYNLYDWLQYGTRLHFNQGFTAHSGLIAASTFILLRSLFPQERGRIQKPVFMALMALFIKNFLSVLLFGFTDALVRYLSYRWYAVIWYEISPVSNLVFASMATYALYLSGQTRWIFLKIPELETEL